MKINIPGSSTTQRVPILRKLQFLYTGTPGVPSQLFVFQILPTPNQLPAKNFSIHKTSCNNKQGTVASARVHICKSFTCCDRSRRLGKARIGIKWFSPKPQNDVLCTKQLRRWMSKITFFISIYWIRLKEIHSQKSLKIQIPNEQIAIQNQEPHT